MGIVDKFSAPKAVPTLPPEIEAGGPVPSPNPEPRPSPSMVGRAERHEVRLHRAVVVALVEAPAAVTVHHEDGVGHKAHEYLWLSPEATTEGLRRAHKAIGAELARRGEE